MKRKKKRKTESKINREDAIEQGFYDGRFKEKVVADKKKKLKKKRLSSKEIEEDWVGGD